MAKHDKRQARNGTTGQNVNRSRKLYKGFRGQQFEEVGF